MCATKVPGMGRRNIGAIQNIGTPPKDDVKKQFDFVLEIAKINTGRTVTPSDLQDRFEQLFQIAHQQGIVPRYEHLVLVSGLPKSTFFDYGNENYIYTPDPEFSVVIKRAKAIISAMEAGLASTGKIPAPVYIFREKNYGGLKDVQEIKAGPITDAVKPDNAQDILNAMPELPESSSASTLQIGEAGSFEE